MTTQELVSFYGNHHNRIVSNVCNALQPQLQKRACSVFPLGRHDMNVRNTFADITIVCETPEYKDTKLNKFLYHVIIQVLSSATEAFHRGKNFQHYRTHEFVREYTMIAGDCVRIEHYRRQENEWILFNADSLDTVVPLHSPLKRCV